MTNIGIVALVVALVLGTSTTVLTLTQDLYAPAGRRWTPPVDDVITYENGQLTSQMNPTYPVEYMECMVTENTAEQGKFTMLCSAYEEIPVTQ